MYVHLGGNFHWIDSEILFYLISSGPLFFNSSTVATWSQIQIFHWCSTICHPAIYNWKKLHLINCNVYIFLKPIFKTNSATYPKKTHRAIQLNSENIQCLSIKSSSEVMTDVRTKGVKSLNTLISIKCSSRLWVSFHMLRKIYEEDVSLRKMSWERLIGATLITPSDPPAQSPYK